MGLGYWSPGAMKWCRSQGFPCSTGTSASCSCGWSSVDRNRNIYVRNQTATIIIHQYPLQLRTKNNKRFKAFHIVSFPFYTASNRNKVTCKDCMNRTVLLSLLPLLFYVSWFSMRFCNLRQEAELTVKYYIIRNMRRSPRFPRYPPHCLRCHSARCCSHWRRQHRAESASRRNTYVTLPRHGKFTISQSQER